MAAHASVADGFLGRLAQICQEQDEHDTASRLAEVRQLLAGELLEVEARLGRIEHALAAADAGGATGPLQRAVTHTLGAAGKRLRPTCVALAARVGQGLHREAYELGVAVELVHAATLLHDDVVDLGELRRGRPTARLVFGNAASIFGGDWLLVDALQRVSRSGVPGLLDRMLAVLIEMLEAESLQLAARSQIAREVRGEDRQGMARRLTAIVGARERGTYFRIVEGKTAALFGWAMFAGGRAGGASPEACDALEAYGRAMGVAFQIVDDVLDVTGDPAELGKAALGDVREGMLTHPVLMAVERDPGVATLLATAATAAAGGAADAEHAPEFAERLARAITASGAIQASLDAAREYSARATSRLSLLPAGPARAALEALAQAALYRTQ